MPAFQPSAYSHPDLGAAVLPLALVVWYGGKWTIQAAATQYAEHLNDKFDFNTVKPEEALEQIGLAENKLWLNTIIGFMGPAANRVQKAPTTLAQAYVKAAYLMALAARYLQNPGLAAAARATLGRIDTIKINTTDAGVLAQVMSQAWNSVRDTAGARVDDPQIRALSIYFGQRPKGGSSQVDMIKSAQGYKLDPVAEGQKVTEGGLLPGLLPSLTGEDKEKNKRKRQKQRQRARKRRERLMIYGGVGAFAVLGLTLLAFKG